LKDTTLGVASDHAAKGEGYATFYLGLRHDETEEAVARLLEVKPERSRDRTVIRPIGHLMPEHRWTDWRVSQTTAVDVAHEMAVAVANYGLPYLESLVQDRDAFLADAKVSGGAGPARSCRVAVLLAMAGRGREALDWSEERRKEAEAGTGPWAAPVLAWTSRFGTWLAQNDSLPG
jgi:hypothetical protein